MPGYAPAGHAAVLGPLALIDAAAILPGDEDVEPLHHLRLEQRSVLCTEGALQWADLEEQVEMLAQIVDEASAIRSLNDRAATGEGLLAKPKDLVSERPIGLRLDGVAIEAPRFIDIERDASRADDALKDLKTRGDHFLANALAPQYAHLDGSAPLVRFKLGRIEAVHPALCNWARTWRWSFRDRVRQTVSMFHRCLHRICP